MILHQNDLSPGRVVIFLSFCTSSLGLALQFLVRKLVPQGSPPRILARTVAMV